MGQNQTKASKLAASAGGAGNGNGGGKLGRHLLPHHSDVSALKSEKASQLQMILEKCKEHPSSAVIIGRSDACTTSHKPAKPQVPSRPRLPARVASGYTSNDSAVSAKTTTSEARTGGSRPTSSCASRTTLESPLGHRCPVADTSRPRERPEPPPRAIATPPLPPRKEIQQQVAPEGGVNGKTPSQQSKRKRKQRKTLKTLKLRRGSSSSLLSRRRSSKKKREMSQLNKSWLAVSGDLEEIGMDLFRR